MTRHRTDAEWKAIFAEADRGKIYEVCAKHEISTMAYWKAKQRLLLGADPKKSSLQEFKDKLATYIEAAPINLRTTYAKGTLRNYQELVAQLYDEVNH